MVSAQKFAPLFISSQGLIQKQPVSSAGMNTFRWMQIKTVDNTNHLKQYVKPSPEEMIGINTLWDMFNLYL